jgi:hypothetical protein
MSFNNSWKAGVIALISTLGSVSLYGQPETDVYVAAFGYPNGVFEVSALSNISQNPGYDNQPYFLSDSDLLYSRTRNDQTDIAKYSIEGRMTTWITETPQGSEYSPVKIPGALAVSSIRLDTTGLQRLYRYPLSGGGPEQLLADLKVGYHVWYDKDLLVCTVLKEEGMDLVVVNLKDNSQFTYQKGVGRSLHRIPGSDRISYTAPEEGKVVVRSLDPGSGDTGFIAELPDGVQDMAWLPDGSLICGSTNQLLSLKPSQNGTWKVLHTFPPELGRITRLAVSPGARWLALTLEQEP